MDTPISISSKLPAQGTTIFTVMSGLAAEHKAINLSQGFPDFDCSDELKKLVSKYMKAGFNQYAPMPGTMALREAIAEKTEKIYSAVYHPETEITVTAGATQAIFTAISAFVREGDEVIVFGPQLSVTTVAKQSGTIAYEVMTGINQRVKRVYFEE